MMTTSNWKLLRVVAVVSLLVFLVWRFWDSSEYKPASEAAKRADEKATTAVSVTRATSIAVAPVRTDRSKNWHSIARQTHLQVVSESLTINEDVIKLLELSPTQAQDLNEMLASFLERLRSEELTHAYVSATPSGEEEIVVPGFPAFDRTDIVSQFRDQVAAKLGTDVGAFIAEEIYWDGTLALNNFELRLGIHRGDDGVDRIVFTRQIRAPENWGSGAPLEAGGPGIHVNFAATDRMITESILHFGINPRYSHLLSAEETLPRRP